ncbi:hypothetical protein BgiBS90_014622 [Biomphalaria glabrata]|nr:hypothetical protein BgiBS90_014622 [Biomphalaria glabrata]
MSSLINVLRKSKYFLQLAQTRFTILNFGKTINVFYWIVRPRAFQYSSARRGHRDIIRTRIGRNSHYCIQQVAKTRKTFHLKQTPTTLTSVDTILETLRAFLFSGSIPNHWSKQAQRTRGTNNWW